ncbi:ORF6N domain-containing protein [Ferruginibacter profundus]
MTKAKPTVVKVTEEKIVEKVYFIRGMKVMLDKDLAEMYGVEVKRLNEAVKRKSQRFPPDFMFELTVEEWNSLRSQIATSKKGRGGARYLPFAFTEQGVAMLSSVLNSDTAVEVNIQIIRVFTKMKQLLFDNKELWNKIEKIERHLVKHDEEIKVIFEYLKKLLVQETKPRKAIGFPYPNKK